MQCGRRFVSAHLRYRLYGNLRGVLRVPIEVTAAVRRRAAGLEEVRAVVKTRWEKEKGLCGGRELKASLPHAAAPDQNLRCILRAQAGVVMCSCVQGCSSLAVVRRAGNAASGG